MQLKLIFQKLFKVNGVSLLSGGLIMMFCWLLAQWTWVIFSPKPGHPDAGKFELTATDALSSNIVGNLFGEGDKVNNTVAKRTETSFNLRLRGVFASTGSLPAFAILSVDGKLDLPVKEGDEIETGLLLEAVYPDYVHLRHNGVLERLDLDSQSGGLKSAPNLSVFKLDVQSRGKGNYGISKNELNQALQNPNQLSQLGGFSSQPGKEGMVVFFAPTGTLANKLGLQQGDVVLRVNGQSVNNNGDINHIYQQLQNLRQVRLEGLRSGGPLQLNYEIQ